MTYTNARKMFYQLISVAGYADRLGNADMTVSEEEVGLLKDRADLESGLEIDRVKYSKQILNTYLNIIRNNFGGQISNITESQVEDYLKKNPRFLPVLQSVSWRPSVTFPNHVRKFMIVISGEKDEPHHLANIGNMSSLLMSYGIPAENVVIFNSATTTPKGAMFLPATRDGVAGGLNTFKPRLNKEDLVFVYITGHGGLDKQEPSVVMEDTNLFHTSELAGLFADLGVSNYIAISDQCYSGDFPDQLARALGVGKNMVAMAPIADKATTSCVGFTPYLIRAIESGYDPDKDGAVTWSEAFQYAMGEYNAYLQPPRPIIGSFRQSHENLSTANLDKVLFSPKPVIVELSAPWCSACKALERDLDHFLPIIGNRIQFYKIPNADEEDGKTVLAKLGERLGGLQVPEGFPVLLYIKDGKLIGAEAGALDMEALQQKVEEKFGVFVSRKDWRNDLTQFLAQNEDVSTVYAHDMLSLGYDSQFIAASYNAVYSDNWPKRTAAYEKLIKSNGELKRWAEEYPEHAIRLCETFSQDIPFKAAPLFMEVMGVLAGTGVKEAYEVIINNLKNDRLDIQNAAISGLANAGSSIEQLKDVTEKIFKYIDTNRKTNYAVAAAQKGFVGALSGLLANCLKMLYSGQKNSKNTTADVDLIVSQVHAKLIYIFNTTQFTSVQREIVSQLSRIVERFWNVTSAAYLIDLVWNSNAASAEAREYFMEEMSRKLAYSLQRLTGRNWIRDEWRTKILDGFSKCRDYVVTRLNTTNDANTRRSCLKLFQSVTYTFYTYCLSSEKKENQKKFWDERYEPFREGCAPLVESELARGNLAKEDIDILRSISFIDACGTLPVWEKYADNPDRNQRLVYAKILGMASQCTSHFKPDQGTVSHIENIFRRGDIEEIKTLMAHFVFVSEYKIYERIRNRIAELTRHRDESLRIDALAALSQINTEMATFEAVQMLKEGESSVKVLDLIVSMAFSTTKKIGAFEPLDSEGRKRFILGLKPKFESADESGVRRFMGTVLKHVEEEEDRRDILVHFYSGLRDGSTKRMFADSLLVQRREVIRVSRALTEELENFERSLSAKEDPSLTAAFFWVKANGVVPNEKDFLEIMRTGISSKHPEVRRYAGELLSQTKYSDVVAEGVFKMVREYAEDEPLGKLIGAMEYISSKKELTYEEQRTLEKLLHLRPEWKLFKKVMEQVDKFLPQVRKGLLERHFFGGDDHRAAFIGAMLARNKDPGKTYSARFERLLKSDVPAGIVAALLYFKNNSLEERVSETLLAKLEKHPSKEVRAATADFTGIVWRWWRQVHD